MAAYKELHIATSHELAQLKCKNDLLCGGTGTPTDQDRELKVAYRCLSEAEHVCHYILLQLDVCREMVDKHTHAIVHL
jgi:hypothetical protein